MSQTPENPEDHPQAPPPYGSQPPPYGSQPPPPPPPAPYPGQHPGQPMLSPADERTWSCAAHWSALVASLVGLSFLGPLIVMLTKGNESATVRAHAVESLNFQLSILIYTIVSAVMILVLIGILLLLAVMIAWLVLTIMATIKVSNGETFRYPMTIRMVS